MLSVVWTTGNTITQSDSFITSVKQKVEKFIVCEKWSYRLTDANINEFLVSKETVVLRRWERSKQKFGFIKRVDKGWITTVKDLESWRFER